MRPIIKYLFGVGVVVIFVIYGGIFALALLKLDRWRPLEAEKILQQSQKTKDKEQSLIDLQEASLLDSNENTNLEAGIKAEELGYDKLSSYYLTNVKTAAGYANLGNAYSSSGQYVLAENAFEKAVAKDRDSRYYLELGKAFMGSDSLSQARGSLESSLQLDNNNLEANYYLSIIYLMEDSSKYTRLEPKLTGAYKMDIDTIIGYTNGFTRNNYLYELLGKGGYPQMALTFLQGQADKNKLDRDGYLLLADDYFSYKNYQKSYHYLLKARALDPYYPQTYQHLIEVTSKLGLNTDASNYQIIYNNLVISTN